MSKKHAAVVLHQQDYTIIRQAVERTVRYETTSADPAMVRDETGDAAERRGPGWVSWDLVPVEDLPARLAQAAAALPPEDVAVVLRWMECRAGDRRGGDRMPLTVRSWRSDELRVEEGG